MMARLIDADANREEFKKILYRTLNDCSITTKKKFNLIITAFDDMPTAYNVEKVVEELESDERHTFDGCINKRYTTEIVRKGGVE